MSHLDPTAAHLTLLEARFGHSSFRPMQWDIIRSVLEDKQDNCAVMSTGYGKSLLYQFPAVFLNRLTVVIAPLISLMQDQVMALNRANIPACFLGSAQNTDVIPGIQAGKYRLVYMTPEYLFEDMGQVLLDSVLDQLVLIAVDEAHCVSKWSHDCRPAFGELHKIRDICPGVPILAVTATATPTVRKDIVSGLRLRSPQVTCSGFDRPNLSFHVKPKKSVNFFHDIVSLIKRSTGGSVLIYCLTRAQTEIVAKRLRVKGIPCAVYHAGMAVEKRKEVHERFVRDQQKVVVATFAFGMGIDKPNVRLVVHNGAPRDIESYYREAGRAGRDGLPSCCVMYWDEEDFRKHEYLREKNCHRMDEREKLLELSAKMRQFLKSNVCRRKFILDYFEGMDNTLPERRDCCDICAIRFKGRPIVSAPAASISSSTLPSSHSKAKFAEEMLEAIRATRGQLAILHSCKPHMVATRNAMQQMTQIRPLTIDELNAAKIDGFSEVKIKKFGQQFVDCIRAKVEALPTIQQILQQVPFMKEKITFFQITTWTLFKEGRSVSEIAKFRRQTEMQIYQLLADAIRHGLSFGWSDFERAGLSRGLYEEIKLKLPRAPLANVDLNVVKKDCSLSISPGQIALVLGYAQVRSHLDANQLLYREEPPTEAIPLPTGSSEHENSEEHEEDDDAMSASLVAEGDFYGFSSSALSDILVAIVSSDDDE